MLDDGRHGDGDPGDGVYGATIPVAAVPGQMIRYRITAGEMPENFARSPVFTNPLAGAGDWLEKQEYWGTVVVDLATDSQLPVIHLFMENPAEADTSTGTRGALFYDGELYDNVWIDDHGFSTLAYPKQSHDVFFPRDHRFRVADGVPRMKDINLLTNYGDPTLLRNTLAYAIRGAVGSRVHLAYPVRVQLNGQFRGIYDFVEDGDDEYLERVGLDPNGALYKMDNALQMGSGSGDWSIEKKTRTWEDYSDLRALIDNLTLEGDDMTAFLFDNIDLPAMVNFIAGLVVVGEVDCCWRNYYVYRDTEGTGEWQYLPWDVDKSMGHIDTFDPNQLEFHLDRAGYPFAYGNRLFTPLFAEPDFVAMYLRRLRTVMDELLQPPGTPAEELVLNRWIDDLAEQLMREIPLEFAAWDRIEPESSWAEQIGLFKEYYFPHRRVFLYGLKGDMNLDGQRDLSDIDDFVLGLTGPAAYAAKYGMPASLRGDLDLDGNLDFDDIGRFVSLMNGHVPSPLRRVEMIPGAQVGTPEIEFGVIDSSPISGNQDEEFIELVNPNDVAVDISGWHLTGGIEYIFRPGVVIPAGKSLYVSPNVVTFRARATGPSGGQSLFVQGDYSGHLSSLGDTIQLVAADGTVIADVTTPAQPTPAQSHLRISEIMYHPPAPAAGSAFDADDYEFIELVNTSASITLDLAGVAFTQGIAFQFPALLLAPGQRAIVVCNAAAFADRYGEAILVAGQYGDAPNSCRLSNGGEGLELQDASGGRIHAFRYADSWYPETDGYGKSIEIIDPVGTDLERWGMKESWLPSIVVGGTPGEPRH